MSVFVYQLKRALLGLQQKPTFVFSIVSTLGITIGALLTILTLAYILFFKGLPYPNYESLVKVEHQLINAEQKNFESSYSYPSVIAAYQENDLFQQSAMIYYGTEILAAHPSQPTISTTFVTPEYFNLFATPMLLGRTFDVSEGLNSNVPMAVISHKTWMEIFAGDEKIIGSTITFWETNYQIVGVSAPTFEEPLLQPDDKVNTQVWLTWDHNSVGQQTRKNWGSIDNQIVFVGALNASLPSLSVKNTLTQSINDKWQAGIAIDPFFKGWSINIELTPLVQAISGEHKQNILFLTLGIIGIVLIACANITNLFITRGAEKKRDMAISAVVGAKKKHIFNYSIAESLILMTASMIVALIICQSSLYWISTSLSAYIPQVQSISFSWFTLAVALVTLAFLAIFFAIITSYMVNYSSLIGLLRASGKGVAAQISSRIRKLLIVSQVTIAALLIFINVSLFEQAITTLIEPASVNTENFIDISLTTTRPPTQEEIDGPVLGTGIRNEFALLPQVESVSNTLSPLSGFRKKPITDIESNRHLISETKYVDDLYFNLIAQPMITGDIFTRSDLHEGFTAPEGKVESTSIIINDVFAHLLAPDESVIGRKLLVDNEEIYHIIGVVKGIKMPGEKSVPVRAYLPASVHSVSMTVQLKENQTITREEIVAAVKRVTSFFAVYSMVNVTDVHQSLLISQKATAYTTGTLALLTIFLSAIGLYGVLNYSIHTQRFEIGTRMALGAKGKDIIALIFKTNISALLYGFMLSLCALFALYIGFTDFIVEYMNHYIVQIYVITLLLITLISYISCYVPLRKYITKPTIHCLRGND